MKADHELTAFTAALSSRLHDRLAVEPKLPDFTDVLRRAAALETSGPLHVAQSAAAPGDAPEDAFEQALRGELPAIDPELGAFVRASRSCMDPQLSATSERLQAAGWQGRGALPVPRIVARLRPSMTTGLVLAASLLLFVGVAAATDLRGTFAGLLSVASSSSMAVNEAESSATRGRAELRYQRSGSSGSFGGSRVIVAGPESTGLALERSPVEPEPLHAKSRRRPGLAQTRQRSVKEGARRDRAGRERAPGHLKQLESEARRAWRAGRLKRAAKLYERLVARAGRRPIAERAFGDLFAVRRSLSGRSGQLSVWRRYLKRFPRGSYAADARAGLCAALPKARASACWRDYVAAHPRGAHVGRARAQLGERI